MGKQKYESQRAEASLIESGIPAASQKEGLLAYPEGRRLVWVFFVGALVLFGCSSLRHGLFHSTAFDLGTFDQAVYLISQGKIPFSSFLEFHILADHASFILYPIALLYKIYPNAHWLFVVQSAGMASGVFPTWYLSRQAGLNPGQSLAMGVAYLLYPLIFNTNLLDFHPDTCALAAFLWAVFFARGKQIWWFCLSIAVIMSCKESFGLAVAAMGVWFLMEKRFLYGAIAVISGVFWFWFASQVIIPHFGTATADISRQLDRYNQLGNSFSEIALNLLLKPNILLSQIFTWKNLYYLFLLFLPFAWAIRWASLVPLVAALPHLAINMLSHMEVMKTLNYWYSIPVMPFVVIMAITTLAAGKGLIKSKRAIIIYAILTFMVMSKSFYFFNNYVEELDTWRPIRTAIAQVPPEVSLLTDKKIAPHLTHRSWVRLSEHGIQPFDMNALPNFEAVLLNSRYPRGRKPASIELMNNILNTLKSNPNFHQQFEQNGVYLFLKK